MDLSANRSLRLGLALAVCLLGASVVLHEFGRALWMPVYYKLLGRKTVADVVARIGPQERVRWRAVFAQQGLEYPPATGVALLVAKAEARLEVWTDGPNPVFLRAVDVTAASGVAGPKLREGDNQVPEGLYAIEGLNPNSAFHLSLKLDYPNAQDRAHGLADGRTDLGSNIFIHGKASSSGCVAVGDAAIESLFVLVADAGRENVRVVIAAHDPRVSALQAAGQPQWVGPLYETISAEFARFQPSTGEATPEGRDDG
ncbi:MAG: L,D-transpeptidase family protein [Pseudomonadota bacterium]